MESSGKYKGSSLLTIGGISCSNNVNEPSKSVLRDITNNTPRTNNIENIPTAPMKGPPCKKNTSVTKPIQFNEDGCRELPKHITTRTQITRKHYEKESNAKLEKSSSVSTAWKENSSRSPTKSSTTFHTPQKQSNSANNTSITPVNKMPVVYGSNVVVDSPDPLSKFKTNKESEIPIYGGSKISKFLQTCKSDIASDSESYAPLAHKLIISDNQTNLSKKNITPLHPQCNAISHTKPNLNKQLESPCDITYRHTPPTNVSQIASQSYRTRNGRLHHSISSTNTSSQHHTPAEADRGTCVAYPSAGIGMARSQSDTTVLSPVVPQRIIDIIEDEESNEEEEDASAIINMECGDDRRHNSMSIQMHVSESDDSDNVFHPKTGGSSPVYSHKQDIQIGQTTIVMDEASSPCDYSKDITSIRKQKYSTSVVRTGGGLNCTAAIGIPVSKSLNFLEENSNSSFSPSIHAPKDANVNKSADEVLAYKYQRPTPPPQRPSPPPPLTAKSGEYIEGSRVGGGGGRFVRKAVAYKVVATTSSSQEDLSASPSCLEPTPPKSGAAERGETRRGDCGAERGDGSSCDEKVNTNITLNSTPKSNGFKGVHSQPLDQHRPLYHHYLLEAMHYTRKGAISGSTYIVRQTGCSQNLQQPHLLAQRKRKKAKSMVVWCPKLEKLVEGEVCEFVMPISNYKERTNCHHEPQKYVINCSSNSNIYKLNDPLLKTHNMRTNGCHDAISFDNDFAVVSTSRLSAEQYHMWCMNQVNDAGLEDEEENEDLLDGVEASEEVVHWRLIKKLFHSIRHGDSALFKSLVDEHDYLVNCCDSNGNSPLIISTVTGWRKAIKYLIKKGCDMNHQNKFGNTCLHFASELEEQHEVESKENQTTNTANSFTEVKLYLMRKGARDDIRNDQGIESSCSGRHGGEKGRSKKVRDSLETF